MDGSRSQGVDSHLERLPPEEPARVSARALDLDDAGGEMVEHIAAYEHHVIARRGAQNAVMVEQHLAGRAGRIAPADAAPARTRAPLTRERINAERIPDKEIHLDEFYAPPAETGHLLGETFRQSRSGRIERKRIAGHFQGIRRLLPRPVRSVPQPRLRAQRGNPLDELLHRHPERGTRLVPRPAAARFDDGRGVLLPAVVHHDVRPVREAFAKSDDARGVGQKIRRRVAAVGAIPVVVTVDRLFGQTRLRTHKPTEFPSGGESGLAAASAAHDELRRAQRTAGQPDRLVRRTDVENELDLPGRDAPPAKGVRLDFHTPAVESVRLFDHHVPRAAEIVRNGAPSGLAVIPLPVVAQKKRLRRMRTLPPQFNLIHRIGRCDKNCSVRSQLHLYAGRGDDFIGLDHRRREGKGGNGRYGGRDQKSHLDTPPASGGTLSLPPDFILPYTKLKRPHRQIPLLSNRTDSNLSFSRFVTIS